MTEITKEDMEEYENIRSSGVTNMFDVGTVVNMSQTLTREKCFEIMKHYSEFMEKFGVKRQ